MGAPQHPHVRPTRGSGVAVIVAVVVIGVILGVLALGTLVAGFWLVQVVPPSSNYTVESIETVEVAAEPVEADAVDLTPGAGDGGSVAEPAESP
jgi:hypothetical protein